MLLLPCSNRNILLLALASLFAHFVTASPFTHPQSPIKVESTLAQSGTAPEPISTVPTATVHDYSASTVASKHSAAPPNKSDRPQNGTVTEQLLTVNPAYNPAASPPLPKGPVATRIGNEETHHERIISGRGKTFSFDENHQPYIVCEIISKARNKSNHRCPWPETEFINKAMGCSATLTLTDPEKYMHNYTDGMFVPREDFTITLANCEHEKLPREFSPCRDDECVASIDVDHMKKYREAGRRASCCCRTHNCNLKVRMQLREPVSIHAEDVKVISTTTSLSTGHQPSTLLVACLVVSAIFIFLLIGLICWCFVCRGKLAARRRGKTGHGDEGMELIERGKKRNDLNANIEIIELLAQGKMAKIEKVRLTDRTTGEERIAVMKSTDYPTFRKEEAVYRLLTNGHENVAHLLGVNTVPEQNLYQLAFKLEELGDLATYLQTSVWSFMDTVRFLTSFMDGLAYIHSPFPQPNGKSLTIAHRDIKSRNILVRADRTAVICDFNCAELLITNSGFPKGRVDQKGTFHYMAPEAIKAYNVNVEGFKMIDIYAAGLVFWEMLNRTQMDEEDEIEPARMPFEAEVEQERAVEEERFLNHPGYNPREKFQPKPVKYILISLINDQGRRPIFREKLRKNLCSKELIWSIEFMWDHESEARLTAAGVHTRLKKLLEYMKKPMDSYDYPNSMFLKQPSNLYFPPTQ